MNIQTITLFTLAFVIQTLSLSAQEFNVMSLNIRFDTPDDRENAWPYRREALAATIMEHKPWFLGVQEAMKHQMAFLDSVLHNYDYIGVGRDDGASDGEFSAIFYPTNQFTCLEQSTFWLSETPDTVSFGWDASYRRVCTYGLFMHKATRERLWVFNTHFDHISKTARRNSAELILHKIDTLTHAFRFPVILMGDFNATLEERAIQTITAQMQYALDISKAPLSGPSGSFNGFIVDNTQDRCIDFVFVNGLDVKSYGHLDAKTPAGRWISDHFPVMATIYLRVGDKH